MGIQLKLLFIRHHRLVISRNLPSKHEIVSYSLLRCFETKKLVSNRQGVWNQRGRVGIKMSWVKNFGKVGYMFFISIQKSKNRLRGFLKYIFPLQYQTHMKERVKRKRIRGHLLKLVHSLSRYIFFKVQSIQSSLEWFLVNLQFGFFFWWKSITFFVKSHSGGYVIKHIIINYSLPNVYFHFKFWRQVTNAMF